MEGHQRKSVLGAQSLIVFVWLRQLSDNELYPPGWDLKLKSRPSLGVVLERGLGFSQHQEQTEEHRANH